MRRVWWLLAGFAAAVALRVAVGGMGVRQSAAAGLVFAGGLAVLIVVGGLVTRVSWRVAAVGLLGAVVLVAPPLVMRLAGAPVHRPQGSYLAWAVVVVVVAAAEEAFLRGVLFEAVVAWRGEMAAILVAAVAFAALHVPLYGWQAAPLDLVVGVWLGALRVTARSWLAPGAAHVLADLAGWWLR